MCWTRPGSALCASSSTRPPIGPTSCPGGEQQRLSIARALLQKPRLAVSRRGDLARSTRRLRLSSTACCSSGCPERRSSRSATARAWSSSMAASSSSSPTHPGRHRLTEALRRKGAAKLTNSASASPSCANQSVVLRSCSRSKRRARSACPSHWTGTLAKGAPNSCFTMVNFGRHVRVAGEVDDPEIVVVVARPGLGHARQDVELEQLAERHRLALELCLELLIGDVLVLPHHHHGLAVQRRVRA